MKPSRHAKTQRRVQRIIPVAHIQDPQLLQQPVRPDVMIAQ